ncbi:hypothetical protein [Terasakiella sp. SH-1]|uniref:hypothetical protein n=1 Tax=Terasakiella sp. SH-1 TaxID=2560057 RepID=UPI00107450E0|nr:hypothetical protein [Terasakiella sp. SH-1]
MTYPSDRQKWRVNGAENVCGVIASEVRKATVRLAFMFPHSSTNIQNHACGDAAWFFVITRRMLLNMTVGDGGCDGISQRNLTTNSGQNREFATGDCYSGGRHA